MAECWGPYLPVSTLEPSSEMKLGSWWNLRAWGRAHGSPWREKPCVSCPVSVPWLPGSPVWQVGIGTVSSCVRVDMTTSNPSFLSLRGSSSVCGHRSTGLSRMLCPFTALPSLHAPHCKPPCFDRPDSSCAISTRGGQWSSLVSLSHITAWKLP